VHFGNGIKLLISLKVQIPIYSWAITFRVTWWLLFG